MQYVLYIGLYNVEIELKKKIDNSFVRLWKRVGNRDSLLAKYGATNKTITNIIQLHHYLTLAIRSIEAIRTCTAWATVVTSAITAIYTRVWVTWIYRYNI